MRQIWPSGSILLYQRAGLVVSQAPPGIPSDMPIIAIFIFDTCRPRHRAAAQTAQGATPETSGAAHLIQIATSSNSFGDDTLLDNAVTNNLPNAVLFVTPNFNPGSISGTYDPHPVGVCYNPGSGRWAILNEDGASMPLSAAFNVLAFAS